MIFRDAFVVKYVLQAFNLIHGFFEVVYHNARRSSVGAKRLHSLDAIFSKPHPLSLIDDQAFYLPRDKAYAVFESFFEALGRRVPASLCDYCCGNGILGIPFWALGSGTTFIDLENSLPIAGAGLEFRKAPTPVKDKNLSPFYREDWFDAIIMNPPFEDYFNFSLCAMRHTNVIMGIAKWGVRGNTIDYLARRFNACGWAFFPLLVEGCSRFDYVLPPYLRRHQKDSTLVCFTYLAINRRAKHENGYLFGTTVIFKEAERVDYTKERVNTSFTNNHEHKCNECGKYYSHSHVLPAKPHTNEMMCPNENCSNHHILAGYYEAHSHRERLSTTLEHQHVCQWCGCQYEHVHSARDDKHKQHSYQCPNEKCEMYFLNGNVIQALNLTHSVMVRSTARQKQALSSSFSVAGW